MRHVLLPILILVGVTTLGEVLVSSREAPSARPRGPVSTQGASSLGVR
jgi:hypothetical protein